MSVCSTCAYMHLYFLLVKSHMSTRNVADTFAWIFLSAGSGNFVHKKRVKSIPYHHLNREDIFK